MQVVGEEWEQQSNSDLHRDYKNGGSIKMEV